MKSLPSDASRAISLLYIAAIVLVLVELAEVAVLSYPPHTGVPSWRYGLLGVLVSKTPNFVLADALILTTALVLEHPRVLRFVGALHLLGALLLIGLGVIYALDALALRRAVKPQFVRGFDLNTARTVSVCLLGSLASLIVFWRTLRTRVTREVREERGVLITDT